MRYDQLVLARKSCRACPELINPADPFLVDYDGPEIGPWSRWLASRPARLVLVGQDWGTEGYFREYQGRDVLENQTNQRLIEFLSLLGFEVGPPNETDYQSGVFATNSILCLKPGDAKELSAPVKSRWFSSCRPFLKSNIDATLAPVVVTLGRHAYEAVSRAFIGQVLLPFRNAVEAAGPINLGADRHLFPVFHPAARPKDRSLSQMRADWARVRQEIARLG